MIWWTVLITPGLAIVVQAALESRAACTTTAGPTAIKPVYEIKIWLKHCDQCLFLQPMLSASIFKLIFGFWTWIPNLRALLKGLIIYSYYWSIMLIVDDQALNLWYHRFIFISFMKNTIILLYKLRTTKIILDWPWQQK